jgi:1,3-beta-glucanosyltransferase GAS5
MDPTKMTGVYSGGLMYEYAMEANGFGIVSISGNTVSELPGFASLSAALAKNTAPSGNGGAVTATSATACPTKDANWLVDSTLLPAIPEGAKAVSPPFIPFNNLKSFAEPLT